jgi:hypothetical protein
MTQDEIQIKANMMKKTFTNISSEGEFYYTLPLFRSSTKNESGNTVTVNIK